MNHQPLFVWNVRGRVPRENALSIIESLACALGLLATAGAVCVTTSSPAIGQAGIATVATAGTPIAPSPVQGSLDIQGGAYGIYVAGDDQPVVHVTAHSINGVAQQVHLHLFSLYLIHRILSPIIHRINSPIILIIIIVVRVISGGST